MKSSLLAIALLLLAIIPCIAQETQSSASESDQPTGFAWLKQFAGTWETVSVQPGAADGAAGQAATMTSRAIGQNWIVNEYRGEIGAVKFQAIQTIGYDTAKKQFTGTWVDSMLSHTWHYKGSLDASGKKLTLEAEGPDWTDMSKMRQYRDTYEIKSQNEIAGTSQMMNDDGEWETFMTSTITRQNDTGGQSRSGSLTTVTPFLMFEGQAEAAINFYKSVFPDTQVESMTKYKVGESGREGTIKVATIAISGQRVMFIDSPIKHEFELTPSFSFFVECENENQLKERFAKLSDGGKVMMPVGNYGFSRQFGWTGDKFGVNWQLNLK